MNTDGSNIYSVWQGRTWSTECSNKNSPPRNGGYDDGVNPNQQPVRLRHNTDVARIVAALQAALVGNVPITQDVATGLYLFQPVGLCLNITNR